MHFTSTSTCMNFLSWFYFFSPNGLYSPWSKREILPILKMSKISKTEVATPTKLHVHVPLPSFSLFNDMHNLLRLEAMPSCTVELKVQGLEDI